MKEPFNITKILLIEKQWKLIGKSMTTTSFLTDLLNRRGTIQNTSTDPIRFLELYGATIVEPTAFEPDPNTYRHEYYYNAVTNVLYRKIVTVVNNNITSARWQKISN